MVRLLVLQVIIDRRITRTIADYKEIDSKYSKTFPYSIVGVLEYSLKDS
jgi:hypothetical protein